MPVVFKARLPKYLQPDDQVVIRGTLKNNPYRISFNFIVDESPLYVALHFKTHFGGAVTAPGKAVVMNSKNVEWNEEQHGENTWQINNDREFHFVFMFLDDSIRIYTGNSQNKTNAFQYAFPHRLPYDRITSFEVWDDMDTVKEISFRYSNSSD